MKPKKKRFAGSTIGEGFVAFPYSVLHSQSLVSLSAKAVKLLVDLASQYRGDNNGDLAAAWKLMRPRGWKSEDTLNKAKQELLASDLIYEARKGRRPNVCSLYAITWRALDPSPKHDYTTRAGFTKGAYRLREPLICRLRTTGQALQIVAPVGVAETNE